MPVEIEAKLKVDSHDEIRRSLSEAGATRLGFVLETNAIFDDSDRSLFAGGRGLRVRHVDVIDGSDSPPTMTYKGPRQPGEFKTRQEIELAISDARAAQSLLAALGFHKVVGFQKRRETWTLGDCHVELDEVPHLGHYVEVEGADADAVHDALQRLGLSGQPVITDSYIALLVDYCKQHDLDIDQIEFANNATDPGHAG